MNVNASVHEFLSLLDVGEKTLMSYHSALTKLTIYLARNNVDNVKSEDINHFRQYMVERKYKERHISNTIGVCKRWYKWACCNDSTATETVFRKPIPIYCECGTAKVRTKRGGFVCPKCKELTKAVTIRSNHSLNHRFPPKSKPNDVDVEQCRTCIYRAHKEMMRCGINCDFFEVTGVSKLTISGYSPPPNCSLYICGNRLGKDSEKGK
jgi:hypothetical protein